MRHLLISLLFVFSLVVPAHAQITAADADFDGNGVVNFADFLLFVSVFGQTIQTTPIPPTEEGSVDGDRAALIALVNATRGSKWEDNRNWLSDRPLSIWFGVTTNAQGRVVEVSLGGNQLSGYSRLCLS